MKKVKLYSIYALSFLLVISGFFLVKENHHIETDYSKINDIEYVDSNHAIDINNMYEVTGFADYVFVAKIVEQKETVYRNVNKTSSGRTTGIPYTEYTVEVLDNLKGNLKKNTPFSLYKFGGKSKSGEHVILQKGDTFFESGKYYIIMAAGQPDGTILQSSPTAYYEFDVEGKSEIMSSKSYSDFKKYVKDEVKYERERFKSQNEN